MNLPNPPPAYSQSDQQNVRSTLSAADRDNVKQGGRFEVGSGLVILKDTADGSRWYLTVTGGVLSVTAV